MPLSRPRDLIVCIALTLAGACSKDSGSMATGYCSAVYTPAVSIVTVDSITGAPLAGGATATLQMTGVSDTLFHGSGAADSVMYGGSAPGTYAVAIVRAGYATWMRGGIVVTPTGVCSEVNTVKLRAQLQPAP